MDEIIRESRKLKSRRKSSSQKLPKPAGIPKAEPQNPELKIRLRECQKIKYLNILRNPTWRLQTINIGRKNKNQLLKARLSFFLEAFGGFRISLSAPKCQSPDFPEYPENPSCGRDYLPYSLSNTRIGLFLVQGAQFTQSPQMAAFYRINRGFKSFGYFFKGHFFGITQKDNLPVRRNQPV